MENKDKPNIPQEEKETEKTRPVANPAKWEPSLPTFLPGPEQDPETGKPYW